MSNFRPRAFRYVGHRVLGLPQPTAVSTSTAGRRVFYLCYTVLGGLCSLSLVVMIILLAGTAMPSVGGL